MATPTKIPVLRTVVTLEMLADVLRKVWPEVEDADVAIVFGKLIAENGWPAMPQCTWNWNIGNIRGVSPKGLFHTLSGAWELVAAGKVDAMKSLGWEVIPAPPQAKVTPGTVCMLPPPEKQGFRAYETLEEAVVDYLDTLEKKFRPAHEELMKEGSDPERLVLALKAAHYFTGDVSQYVTNVKSGYAYALKHMPARPPPVEEAPLPVPTLLAEKPVEVPSVLGFIEGLADKEGGG